jgi:hypothetical protein
VELSNSLCRSQNSVRHQLSLNKAFRKEAKDENSKGMYWIIDPSYLGRFEDGPRARVPPKPKVKGEVLSDGGGNASGAGEPAKRESKKEKPRKNEATVSYGLFDGEETSEMVSVFKGVPDLDMTRFLNRADFVKYLRRPGDPAAYEFSGAEVMEPSQIMKRMHGQYYLFRLGDQAPQSGIAVNEDMLARTRTLPTVGTAEGSDLMQKMAAEIMAKALPPKPPAAKKASLAPPATPATA